MTEERTFFLNSVDLADYEARTGSKVKNPKIVDREGTESTWQTTSKNGLIVPVEKQETPFTWASDVAIEPAKWLWYPYILDENTNAFGGETGTGKTWNLCSIAAAVTTKQPQEMPGIVEKHGNVLYLGGEDGNGGTAERLKDVGADLSRVALVENVFDCTGPEVLGLLDKVDPALVIFDPLLSYTPKGSNINDYVGARQIMDYLREVAREKRTSIITVVHPPKRGDYKLLYRFTGSGGIVDSVRTATYVGYHPTEKNMRVGIQPKNNLIYTEPYMFRLDPELGFQWAGKDGSITSSDVEKAMRYEISGGDSLKYYEKVIVEVMKVNPQGLHATAADILKKFSEIVTHKIDSVSFGKALNNEDLRDALSRKGISLTKGSNAHNKQKYQLHYKDYKPFA